MKPMQPIQVILCRISFPVRVFFVWPPVGQNGINESFARFWIRRGISLLSQPERFVARGALVQLSRVLQPFDFLVGGEIRSCRKRVDR